MSVGHKPRAMSVRYAQSSNDDQTASHRPVGDIRDYAAASLFGTAGRFDIVAFWVGADLTGMHLVIRGSGRLFGNRLRLLVLARVRTCAGGRSIYHSMTCGRANSAHAYPDADALRHHFHLGLVLGGADGLS
jgi:hypothetical protein